MLIMLRISRKDGTPANAAGIAFDANREVMKNGRSSDDRDSFTVSGRIFLMHARTRAAIINPPLLVESIAHFAFARASIEYPAMDAEPNISLITPLIKETARREIAKFIEAFIPEFSFAYTLPIAAQADNAAGKTANILNVLYAYAASIVPNASEKNAAMMADTIIFAFSVRALLITAMITVVRMQDTNTVQLIASAPVRVLLPSMMQANAIRARTKDLYFFIDQNPPLYY